MLRVHGLGKWAAILGVLVLLAAWTAPARGAADPTPTVTPVVNPCAACDANGDSKVNAIDLSAFSWAYGSTSGQANYRPGMDRNGDGVINAEDVSGFSGCYGQSW
jgi:hypothetical protein